MQDSNDIFYHKIAENLYPKSPYQYNFGGDPREIVKMTHDELLAFHKKFYHPSNSRTVTYGDLPIEPTLQFIGERASEVFKQKGEDTPIPDEPRWTKPRTATVYGPLSPSTLKTLFFFIPKCMANSFYFCSRRSRKADQNVSYMVMRPIFGSSNRFLCVFSDQTN
jgi:Zn-dependent M16 (insulinase) family peptidase